MGKYMPILNSKANHRSHWEGITLATNVVIIVNHLRSYLGDIAEDYVNTELVKIYRKNIDQLTNPNTIFRALPNEQARIEDCDLELLLNNIGVSLEKIFGERYSHVIIDRIRSDFS